MQIITPNIKDILILQKKKKKNKKIKKKKFCNNIVYICMYDKILYLLINNYMLLFLKLEI